MAVASQNIMIEAAFRRARAGDADAFAEWMKMVEHPLWRSLARFARHIDLEVVVQETFLRMWIVACDPGRHLEGEYASLKFALRVARNVGLEELRRTRCGSTVSFDEQPEPPVCFDFPDPLLKKTIYRCFDLLPQKPKSAMAARLQDGHRSFQRRAPIRLRLPPRLAVRRPRAGGVAEVGLIELQAREVGPASIPSADGRRPREAQPLSRRLEEGRSDHPPRDSRRAQGHGTMPFRCGRGLAGPKLADLGRIGRGRPGPQGIAAGHRGQEGDREQ